MSITSYNESWLNIKYAMLNNLYTDQIEHWNIRLRKLMQRNASMHDVILSEDQCQFAALQYEHKTWTCLPLNWMQSEQPVDYHFTWHENAKELTGELVTVLHELVKLKKERYESDRFISSMGLFTPTKVDLAAVFGDNLYSLIKVSARGLSQTEDIVMFGSLDDFVNNHQRILDHMQERVLVNLLMSDILK